MKQTAVEWLELNLLGLISFDSEELRAKYKERVAKAKQMEKQQIIDAYAQAEDNCEWLIEEHKWQRFHSQQYYDKTFSK
jgi:hypothetical protein